MKRSIEVHKLSSSHMHQCWQKHQKTSTAKKSSNPPVISWSELYSNAAIYREIRTRSNACSQKFLQMHHLVLSFLIWEASCNRMPPLTLAWIGTRNGWKKSINKWTQCPKNILVGDLQPRLLEFIGTIYEQELLQDKLHIHLSLQLGVFFFHGLFTDTFGTEIIESNGRMIWMKMNCKGFGRKCSCLNQGTIPTLAWKAWGKQQEPGVLVGIWSKHILNTYLEHYLYMNLFDSWVRIHLEIAHECVCQQMLAQFTRKKY